jgi:hypothetical protein
MKKWLTKLSVITTMLIKLIMSIIMTMMTIIIIIINVSDIFLTEIVEICLCDVMQRKWKIK